MHDLTPLRLYNCMTPTLKEHRLLKPDLNNVSQGRYDMRYAKEMKRIELEMQKNELAFRKEDLEIMKQKMDMVQEENMLIDWYV